MLVFRKLGTIQRVQKGFDLPDGQSVVRNSFRLLERNQRYGIIRDDSAVFGVFENLRKERPQVVIESAAYARHDSIYVDCLYEENRLFAENRGDIPSVLACVIVPRLRKDFSLLVFEPLRCDFVKQIQACFFLFCLVFLNLSRFGYFQELLFCVFDIFCRSGQVISAPTVTYFVIEACFPAWTFITYAASPLQ